LAAGAFEKPISPDVNLEDQESEDSALEEKPKRRKRKDESSDGRSGRRGRFVVLLLILFFLGLIIGVVGFNVFDIRDKYLITTLEKIPLVNRLLPQADDIEAEVPEVEPPVVEELRAKLAAAEHLLEQSRQAERDTARMNGLYVEEISRLLEFENDQVQFRADKAEFDRMIAMNDPTAYSRFYAQIAPENAEILGPEAIAAAELQKEFLNYIKTIGAMEEKDVALMLTEMIRSDLDLVVRILSNLPTDFAGAVWSAMEPKDAASIAKRWSPN